MDAPVARWRRWLAHLVVAGHRFAMCVLYFAVMAVFLRLLVKEHSGAAPVAIGLMAAAFVGTFWLAGRLLPVSPRPVRRGAAGRTLLRLYRAFVGNGDAIQALARRIDPRWRNPYPGRTPHETAYWLCSVEVMHWALLAASVPLVAAALWFGHYALGLVGVAANMLFNVAPNLVMRDTRRRLLRLSGRTPAAGTNTDHSGGEAAAPVPEVSSAGSQRGRGPILDPEQERPFSLPGS